MRLLFITIEFTAATFSGNGVHARSQVRALSRLGHEVVVLSGKPTGYDGDPRPEGAVSLLEVELSDWGQLGLSCAWKEFMAGASSPNIVQAVASFQPEAVLGVDWHSLGPYASLCQAWHAHGSSLAPYVYMNYRVFLRTAVGQDAVLLEGMERRALQRAVCATVLGRTDATCLAETFPDLTSSTPMHVLLPGLRQDMACLPVPADVAEHAQQLGAAKGASPEANTPGVAEREGMDHQQQQQQQHPLLAAGATPTPPLVPGVDPGRGRHLLTCSVRISPEKEPGRFVDLVAELSRRGALAQYEVVPLMFGAGWDSEYGKQLRRRVEEDVPECIVLDTFMGASQLAAIYASTLLNIHPCCYDAYGMTVVEAASQGAPSLVNEGGHVGATDLLDESSGEVICVNLTRPPAELAARVETLLRSLDALRCVGRAAACKARSWTEEANAAQLVDIVRGALAHKG